MSDRPGGRPSDARAELAALDPALAKIIDAVESTEIDERLWSRMEDRFLALLRIIVGQQVSTAAAETVWGRVLEAFDGLPTPENVSAPEGEQLLRDAGLSGRKASYAAGIAQSVAAGELRLDELDEMEDAEVIETLVALRGIGPWSAEMFLLFDLGRPDVFSGGDLGLREGIRIALELEEAPTPEEAVAIAERWSPHRSLACLYLWAAVHAGAG
ncbi:MAG: DNA-3-methyladenine glycosylase [Solirubrobacterales bacterium]